MLLKTAELESPRERGLDALEGSFGHCKNVLKSPVLAATTALGRDNCWKGKRKDLVLC